MRSAKLLALCISLSLCLPLLGQDPHAGHDMAAMSGKVGYVPNSVLEAPTTLKAASEVGPLHDPVTTSSPEAQKFYDQGEAYLHSYVWIEAARSFNQALRLDPKLALAYVGLSRVYTGLEDAAAAQKAEDKALALKKGISAREQRRIDLRAKHLEALNAITDKQKFKEYKQAIEAALQKDPDDAELWLIRGNAEESTAAGRGQGGDVLSIAYYEAANACTPGGNFAAHHYLIHTYEHVGRNDKAADEGAIYSRMAAGVPHAHHMYGHDLRLVGRIGEAIHEFEVANELELAYYRKEGVAADLDWHRSHNLDLLGRSLQHEGEMKQAEQVFKEAFALKAVDAFGSARRSMLADFLLLRARPQEALVAAHDMTHSQWPLPKMSGELLAARANIDLGKIPAAQKDLAEAKELVSKIERFTQVVPFDMQGAMKPGTDEVEAEIMLAQGKPGSEKIFKEVAEEASEHRGADALGELFLIERMARVNKAYKQVATVDWLADKMIAFDDAYAGGHFFKGWALAQSKNTDAARKEYARARALWSHADAELPENAEITDYLAKVVASK
jgi:tetratricopeptide (TPR) repeat protein